MPTPAPRPVRRGLAWGIATIALLGVGFFTATRVLEPAAGPLSTPEAGHGVVVGTPGGVAFPQPTPVPTAAPAATPAATAMPTSASNPVATPAPTIVATVAPTVAPPVAMQTPPAAPSEPAAGTAADPAETVFSFYEFVAGANFDAAYALWGERMRAAYTRDPNLDRRFDETAEITFSQLSVAERSADSATVQANFIETYESGGSREFIGYWRLVLVEGRWLLDEPHY